MARVGMVPTWGPDGGANFRKSAGEWAAVGAAPPDESFRKLETSR